MNIIRIIMIVIIIAGLFTAVTSLLAKGMTSARGASLLCSIHDLLTEDNSENIQRAEKQATELLYGARDSFGRIAIGGIVVALLGFIGACIRVTAETKASNQRLERTGVPPSAQP